MNPSLLTAISKGLQAASNLVFFHQLLHEPVFNSWFNLVKALQEDDSAVDKYIDFLAQITMSALETSGDSWEYYLDREVLLLDNDLTRRLQGDTEPSPSLLAALSRETVLLNRIREVNAGLLGQLCQQIAAEELPIAAGWGSKASHLPAAGSESLVTRYRQMGSGPAAVYQVLRWHPSEGIIGVAHPDQITLHDLVGYQRQKDALLNNTQRLLTGLPSQHALLYGPKGSGKSSLIKAVARRYSSEGLRLIEVAADDLESLPAIVDYVRGRCQYFIIYIDDLSFEAYETGYKSLKNLLEGGVENRPANLAVYATSNRRHIIQEYYSDRLDGDDLHPGETRQEKLALADRFGLSIFFPNADQQLYLDMVMTMADRRGINLPEAELTARALTWEKERSGPSGRAARQFVDSL